MTIRDTLLGMINAVDLSALKRLPTPGQLYRQPLGIITAGPLGFPGYADRRAEAQNQTDQQRAKFAIQSSWVYSDIRAISNELSTASMVVSKRGKSTVQPKVKKQNHPLELLFARPNPYMGASFLLQYWCWQLLLTGEAYLYFPPNTGRTEIQEIWPVPSNFISPRTHPKEFIAGYDFRMKNDQDPILIRPEYIVYSRIPNPFDIHRGLSPIAAAFIAVQTDESQAKWNRDWFGKRNAIPTALGILPAATNEPDFLRIKNEIFEWFGSGRREIAVTRAGDLDFKMLNVSQKEMDFMRGREMNRTEIDRAFGIPDGYWSSAATEANARHAKGALIENAVWPLLVMFGEDVTAQLVPNWYGEEYSAAFSDIRPRNVDLEMRERTTWGAYRSINEIRASDGLGAWKGEAYSDVPAVVGTVILQQGRKEIAAPEMSQGFGGTDLSGLGAEGEGEGAPPLEEGSGSSVGRSKHGANRGSNPDDSPEYNQAFNLADILETRSLSPDELRKLLDAPVKNLLTNRQLLQIGSKELHNPPIPVPGDSESEKVTKPLLRFSGRLADTPDEYEEAQKKEFRLWQGKSLKSLKRGKSAAVRFESDFIPEHLNTQIQSKLRLATTPEEVKAVFDEIGVKMIDVKTVEEQFAELAAEFRRNIR